MSDHRRQRIEGAGAAADESGIPRVHLQAGDPRLAYWCPQGVDRSRAEVRLDRFPATITAVLHGQVGALANLRSSSGCAVVLRSDAPWIDLHLARLRHHQLVPQHIALEVEQADGVLVTVSEDLREREGDVTLRLATGLHPGAEPARIWCWLPTISTCAIAGVSLPAGSSSETAALPEADWLAIGDSLTQGFSVAVPTQAWVHRCQRAWGLWPANLGIGGVQIHAEVFRWALEQRRYRLVTIGLGSNHAWRDSDVEAVAGAADELARIATQGDHGRICWLLPPWKPCEDGYGPSDFAGIPLDRAAGERIARVRTILREVLVRHPRIEVIADLAAHDHRLYPDGLHPLALGAARYARALQEHLVWRRP